MPGIEPTDRLLTTQNLLVELFVEELPPKALQKLGDAFATVLGDQLKAQGLASAALWSRVRLAPPPGRPCDRVADKAPTRPCSKADARDRGPGQDGRHPALLKSCRRWVPMSNAAVAALKRAQDGKAEALFYDSVVPGATLQAGPAKA